MRRAHIYLTWEKLAELLQVPGRPIKVWSESDQDYLHVMLEDERFPDIPVGSYVESTTPENLRRDFGL